MEKPERRGWKWASHEDRVAQFSRPKMAQFEKTVDKYLTEIENWLKSVGCNAAHIKEEMKKVKDIRRYLKYD